MNRNEEYAALMEELEATPDELDTTVERAERRCSRKRLGRILGIPVGSLAACFVLFMLLVNLFPPFAYACGRIPALKSLAQAVAWSPSLSAAVENEYVQSIEESKAVNGVAATVHYVIVDRKQLNIFYSLDYPEEEYPNCYVGYAFSEMDGWCGTVGSGMLESGAIQRIDLSFMEQDVPPELDLTLRLYRSGAEEQPFAEFPFHLTFDPAYTEQGKYIPVNRTFTLDGQTLTLTELELYPTHLRITIEGAEENIFWLNSLDLYVENERGEQFRPPKNGITASGDTDTDGMATFWLDSPWFRDGDHLTLYLKGVRWKEKDSAWVEVDLRNNTCTELPGDTRFGGAEQENGIWEVRFIHPYAGENTMYNAFGSHFRDEAGEEYTIDSFSHTFGYLDPKTGERREEDSCFTESFLLQGLAGDRVFLDLQYNRSTELTEPIVVPIR